jgi:hypothetical protein
MAGTPQQCKPITVGPIQKYTYSTKCDALVIDCLIGKPNDQAGFLSILC